MYSYTWDTETGGLLLNSSPLQFSKEPRPVYSKELDLLGFDRYWQYDRNDSMPIMWAEANNYIYRGRLVAQLKGGAPFIRPSIVIIEDPKPRNAKLKNVDLRKMVERNMDLMEKITQETIKKIYNYYIQYQNKVDLFYVAFSGGKDSVLVLDLVQRALPHESFKVLFGDTQMEFPDTYKTIEKTKEFCQKNHIDFITATSDLSPLNTWRIFGPPAQKIRWCCSVHKTSPQVVLLRKITGKPNFRGMAFTGIRAEESSSRASYDEISLGEKVRGQYSCHPIFDWNSAELFIYTYANNLIINETYKKGNSRAGCLVCPLAGYKNMWFKEQCYSHNEEGFPTTTQFNDIIVETSAKDFSSKSALDEFMNIAGWKARRSGRELSIAKSLVTEIQDDTCLTISLNSPKSDWREWLKTVGQYSFIDSQNIELQWDNKIYRIVVSQGNLNEITFKLIVGNTKSEILLKKSFKIALRKAAYCIGCKVCEANCPFGFIEFKKGELSINDKCIRCRKCHDIDYGCLVANSNRLPQKDKKMGSINRYGNMGIEFEWIKQYFKKNDEFWTSDHCLGTRMVKNLISFLNDSEITTNKKFNQFGAFVDNLGIEHPKTWAVILCNLAYSSEFNWWITNVEFNRTYTVDMLKELLSEETDTSQTHIISAFKNILISNQVLANDVGLGNCDYYIKGTKRYLNSVIRMPWSQPNPEVILYSLYKFAEACGDYKQFTLNRLMDDSIDSDGVTPSQIFGIEKDELKKMLSGLAANYQDFINVSFTLDLDNITLKEDKTSKDVLELIK